MINSKGVLIYREIKKTKIKERKEIKKNVIRYTKRKEDDLTKQNVN